MATTGTINGAGSITIECPGCCTSTSCTDCASLCSNNAPKKYLATFSGVETCPCQDSRDGTYSAQAVGSLNNTYTLNLGTPAPTLCPFAATTTIVSNQYDAGGCSGTPTVENFIINLSVMSYTSCITPTFHSTDIYLTVQDGSGNFLFIGRICGAHGQTSVGCCQTITLDNLLTCGPDDASDSPLTKWKLDCRDTTEACSPGFFGFLLGSGGTCVLTPTS